MMGDRNRVYKIILNPFLGDFDNDLQLATSRGKR
jgi:hypothetical protein